MDPQYSLEPGQPDRSKSSVPPATGGEINWPMLREERYDNPSVDEDFSRVLHIVRRSSSIRDKQTDDVLGSATTFLYGGGWLVENIGPHVVRWECPNSPSDKNYIHSILLTKIFRREKSLYPQ